MMVISNGQPASVTWDYDRVELIADGIVHAIGAVSYTHLTLPTIYSV